MKKFLAISEYPDVWGLAQAEREGKPLFLRYRKGLEDAVGHSDYPFQIGVAVPLLDPTEDGLTKDVEAKELQKFEEKLDDVLSENSEGVEALIITYNGMREFVFYVKERKPEYYQQKVESIDAGNHKPQFMIQPDQKWETFQQFTPNK